MKTVAIIPALNEFHKLSQVVLATQRHIDAVIVVDDGSKQPLRDLLPASPTLFVLRHRINLGKGAALKTGIAYAKNLGADYIVLLDADGQHVPDEIPSLLRPLQHGGADIVFGVRQFHGSMPMMARLGNVFLTKTLGALFHIHVSDTQSGFRAFKMSVYSSLEWESPRYSVETEMIVNVGKHKLAFVEVPIRTVYHDKYRGTTIIDGMQIFFQMIRWRFE